MQWVGNNLIDDKNKFLVGYIDGNDWYDSACITVYDNKDNNITHDDLSDWEFAEFPDLNAQNDYAEDQILIVNKKLGITGKVILECENNGYYSANYWTEKNRIL